MIRTISFLIVNLEGDLVVTGILNCVEGCILSNLPGSDVHQLELVAAGSLSDKLDNAGAALSSEADGCVTVLLN